jgi:antitoxin (DNA-binding transcriptional repressor) of toxin-antitoxin stability system
MENERLRGHSRRLDNFKFKLNFTRMETISMLEIRRDTRRLIERLRRGESFTVTYRKRPVGELRPVADTPAIREDDPVYRLAGHAEDLGESLDARQADSLLYNEFVIMEELGIRDAFTHDGHFTEAGFVRLLG